MAGTTHQGGTISFTKDGIVLVHSFLYRLAHALITDGTLPTDALLEYNALGCTPVRIDLDKRAHLKAIDALMQTIDPVFKHKTKLPSLFGPVEATWKL